MNTQYYSSTMDYDENELQSPLLRDVAEIKESLFSVNNYFTNTLTVDNKILKTIYLISQSINDLLLNNSDCSKLNLTEYINALELALMDMSIKIDIARDSLDSLKNGIADNKRKENSISKNIFITYLKEWIKNGLVILRKNIVFDIHAVIHLIDINSHLATDSIIDHLILLKNNYCYFYIKRCHNNHYSVIENFALDIYEIEKFKDDWIGLLANKHQVTREKYLQWFEQITNPRCHSLTREGVPCANLTTIKHAKNPKIFSIPEYTCCHLHREVHR